MKRTQPEELADCPEIVNLYIELRTSVGCAALRGRLPVALSASKIVESFLFGMQPNDPAALIGSAFTLVAAVILAGYIPARKASSIDPVAALRHE